MKRAFPIAFVRSLACAAGLICFAGDDKPVPEVATPKKIAMLIKQLGDAEWRIRQKATEELDKIGRPALEAVQAAVKNPDAEVATRARKLLNGWRGFLGVEVAQRVTGDATMPYVARVLIGTAAEKAELAADDLILALDGERALTSQEFVARLRERFAGDRVELTVQRNGEEKKISVQLGRWPTDLNGPLNEEP